MRKYLLYFSIIIAGTILLQSCSVKARVKKADKQFAIGEYYSAGEKYRRVVSQIPAKDKPLRARVFFNLAECYRILNYRNAEQMYGNAIRFGYADSTVYLRYAQVLQRNGKYDVAAKNYAIFLESNPENVFAKNGEISRDQVKIINEQPTNYIVNKYGAFNARRSYTFSPAFLNNDGDVLFFTSNKSINRKGIKKSSAITGSGLNKIYTVRKNAAGKWEKPEIVEAEINTASTDDGACCFNSDGTIMYFTRARQKTATDTGTEIYISNRAGGTWSTPKKLEIFKDSTISVAHPALSPDGQILYFTSDAPNGFGGKDIWKATIDGTECKVIENLGEDINTPGDEMFPSVRVDGTLYFSSNGHVGLGGLDIFKATKNADGSWILQNMGVPINSNGDDFGITFEGKNDKGFFSSNRGETRGYDALYTFELPVFEYVVEGKIMDDNSNPIPDAIVRLVGTNGLNVKVQAKKDGTYKIKLDKDIDCVMMTSARGYLNSSKSVSTQGVKKSEVYTRDFKLSTIYKPIKLDNIFYEFGKWNLTPESETGLQALIKILKDNPNITIEISANTDHVGNNESNKILSEKRAKSVVDYLIANGIKADRLSSVGNGEDKPVVADAALAGKYNFLKENEVLDEAVLDKLTPEQQEIVNQINRRTEFRVLKTTYK
ncbi:MAG: OmpA family protein [Paludibacter sp.]|nr:OmpA family protein [Paludibacter sp.]